MANVLVNNHPSHTTTTTTTTTNNNNNNNFPILNVLNVEIGARVIKNKQGWQENWGRKSNHPPDEGEGTVVGWTDSFSTIFGDPEVGEFSEIVRVKFDNEKHCYNYRIGFANEFWLQLVSGGTIRKKKCFGDDLHNEACTGCFYKSLKIEDMNGQEVNFIATPASEKEMSFEPKLQVFWRLHAGDVESVQKLLSENSSEINIDEGILPYLFQSKDSKTLRWPYFEFDGVYGDTLLSLATRYCHVEMISMLLSNGASKQVKNKDGETVVDIATKIIADSSCICVKLFSSEHFTAIFCKLFQLERGGDGKKSIQNAICDNKNQLLCHPAFDVSTCYVDNKSVNRKISWILINGHSDKEQIEYCQSMMDAWESVLRKRGDHIAEILTCPTKANLSLSLTQHFKTYANTPTGIFVIAHGGSKEGEWVSFNPDNENESFSWKDIVSAGALEYPSQLVLVADTCYSARLGKIAFEDLLEKQMENKMVNLPSFCMLSASDLPEKNFSISFALNQFQKHRMLSKETCDRFISNNCFIAIAENIVCIETNDFNPYLYLFVPLSVLLQMSENAQPIFTL